jgi:ribonuclease J
VATAMWFVSRRGLRRSSMRFRPGGSTGRGDLVGDPWIEMTGLPVAASADKTMQEIVADAVEDALTNLPKGRRRDPGALEQAIERSVRGSVNAVWGKRPLCHVMIIQV